MVHNYVHVIFYCW